MFFLSQGSAGHPSIGINAEGSEIIFGFDCHSVNFCYATIPVSGEPGKVISLKEYGKDGHVTYCGKPVVLLELTLSFSLSKAIPGSPDYLLYVKHYNESGEYISSSEMTNIPENSHDTGMLVFNRNNPQQNTFTTLRTLIPEITYANNPSATTTLMDGRIVFAVEAIIPSNGGEQILWMGEDCLIPLTITQSWIVHLTSL